MQHEATIRWLKIACAITIGFGVLMVVAVIPALSAPASMLLDLVFLPVDGAQQLADPGARLLSAISGGVLIGWGVLIWQLASKLYAREPMLVRGLIITSILSWFVFDSTGSILAGAPLNAVFNVGFLVLFIVPVLKKPAE